MIGLNNTQGKIVVEKRKSTKRMNYRTYVATDDGSWVRKDDLRRAKMTVGGTHAERAALTAAAKRAGKSLSAYMLDAALQMAEAAA